MTAVIGEFFRSHEIAMLHRGIADLAQVSTSLLVPFTARRLMAAQVAWLNVRWFLQHGLDVTDATERERVERWLLAEFGYVVVDGAAPGAMGGSKIFHSDRYGSTEGTTPHGGGGRSGIAGRFSAKGIGPTPLVGVGAMPGHAHGCATLEECLREAVYSEVAGAEFPWGAVPVIAVLDAGISFMDPDAQGLRSRQARRGLLIRPCVLRPAHAERAPLFRAGASGTPSGRTSQQHDVARTRAMVRAWLGDSLPGGCAVAPDVWIIRMAQQIAYAQVHRLTNGGVFSSNVSLTAELLDFGNGHALPDWSYAKMLDHAAGFGAEMVTLRAVARSLAFYFWKYGDHVAPRPEAIEHRLFSLAEAAYRQAFEQECMSLFGMKEGSPAPPWLPHLRQYFAHQQRRRVRYQYGRPTGEEVPPDPWLGDDVASRLASSSPSLPADVRTEPIHASLKEMHAGTPASVDPLRAAYVTASRRLSQRPALDRGELIARLNRLVDEVTEAAAPMASRIETTVDGLIGRSRTHWRHLPASLVVLAKKAWGHSCILFCRDMQDGTDVVWLSGVALGERLHWFGTWMSSDTELPHSTRRADGEWSVAIRVSSHASWYASVAAPAAVMRLAPGQIDSYDFVEKLPTH